MPRYKRSSFLILTFEVVEASVTAVLVIYFFLSKTGCGAVWEEKISSIRNSTAIVSMTWKFYFSY